MEPRSRNLQRREKFTSRVSSLARWRFLSRDHPSRLDEITCRRAVTINDNSCNGLFSVYSNVSDRCYRRALSPDRRARSLAGVERFRW